MSTEVEERESVGHTAGPWYLLSGNGDYNISRTTGPDWARDINYVGIFSGSEANARLIAAAPTMYSFISDLLDCEGADEAHDLLVNYGPEIIGKVR